MNITLHVSDGLSVHHQEFKTVCTALVMYLMLYVQYWTPDDGRKDRPKHVEWYSLNLKNCASSWFDAVCSVLNSWWWMERLSETCTVIFNKLKNCASSWIYYRKKTNCNTIYEKTWKLCVRIMSSTFDNMITVVIHISFHSTNRGKQTPVHGLMNRTKSIHISWQETTTMNQFLWPTLHTI